MTCHSPREADTRPPAESFSPTTDTVQARAQPRHVLITGASSGIGAALALAYAEEGLRLALFGRDEGRARGVAEACRAKGALVAVILVDVADGEAMASAVRLVDDAHPVDLVIANAGVGAAVLGEGGTGGPLVAVNVMGGGHTIQPLRPLLLRRPPGPTAA